MYRPRKDERLSWPSWLTCSGRLTHIVVTRRLQAERRTGSVRRPKIGVPPTVLTFIAAKKCILTYLRNINNYIGASLMCDRAQVPFYFFLCK